jgi:hypothetical protein
MNEMQATLVAFYGFDKPQQFVHLIAECQNWAGHLLGGAFNSYPLEQVHGTIIGLEGSVEGERILNRNFRDIGQDREMLIYEMIRQCRSFEPFTIRLGGWQDKEYGFRNGMNESPYEGSFFVRGGLSGAMGWPVAETESGDETTRRLYDLRKMLEVEANVLHRWHRDPNFIDNDFFFRIGLTPLQDSDPLVETARSEMRRYMSQHDSVELVIRPETLTVVAYTDNKLPWESDPQNRRNLEDVTTGWIREVYGR